jgi:hypothetical protein
MKPKLILCLALVLSGVLVFWLWLFPYFFWGMNRPWIQVSEIAKFHSGEKLVREDHFLSGFPKSILQNSKLSIQWTNDESELLVSTNHYSSVNHYALSKDGDMYVIGIDRTVYYRQKKSPENQWGSWSLTASPEIYSFIKNYLDAHSPGSYASDTNEFAPAGAIEIKCNHLGEEQPLIIAPQGDFSYAYEIETIRNQGREIIAVPFASNPFAPKKLIFSQDADLGGWKFDETLTAKAN